DGCAALNRCARVDPVLRDEQLRPDVEVRGREAERPAARVAGDDDALDLDRTAEQPCGGPDVAVSHELPDPGRRDICEQWNGPRREAEALEQRKIAPARAPEAEVLASDDRLGTDRTQELVGELLRLEPGDVERELDDERGVDAQRREQLQTPLERHQEVDP